MNQNTFVVSVSELRDYQSDGIMVKAVSSLNIAQIEAEYLSSKSNRIMITELNSKGVVNRWIVTDKTKIEQLEVY